MKATTDRFPTQQLFSTLNSQHYPVRSDGPGPCWALTSPQHPAVRPLQPEPRIPLSPAAVLGLA